MSSEQSTPVNLSTALSSVVMNGNSGQFECFADWAQGRTEFGGLSAAAALRAMRSKIDGERKLRSMLVSFVGPISIGLVDVQLQVLREGRSASQVEVKLLQEGTVRLVALATFGQDRPSEIVNSTGLPEGTPAIEETQKLPFVEGLSPQFTSSVDFYYSAGQFPLSGGKGSQLGGYFRFTDIAGVASEELIVLLSDAWPPAKLQCFAKPAPISTISWSIDLTAKAAAVEPGGFWYLMSEAEASEFGYSQQRSRLYSPAGELIALNQQTVALFA